VHADDNNNALSEDPLFLMAAIGQLSVWSFHDILNNIFKLEGYCEIAAQTADKIEDEKIKADLHKYCDIMNTSIHNITNTINRIRALRGKMESSPAEHALAWLIENSHKKTQMPPKIAKFNIEDTAYVKLFCDKIIFEQIWFHLWKLLYQCAPETGALQAICQCQIENDDTENVPPYQKKLHLYMWLEQNEESSFHPQELHYEEDNLSIQKDHIMYFTKKLGEKIPCIILSAKNAQNSKVFMLSIPCKKTV
jgi:hypothetical protein